MYMYMYMYLICYKMIHIIQCIYQYSVYIDLHVHEWVHVCVVETYCTYLQGIGVGQDWHKPQRDKRELAPPP